MGSCLYSAAVSSKIEGRRLQSLTHGNMSWHTRGAARYASATSRAPQAGAPPASRMVWGTTARSAAHQHIITWQGSSRRTTSPQQNRALLATPHGRSRIAVQKCVLRSSDITCQYMSRTWSFLAATTNPNLTARHQFTGTT
jgi:hypothetical protein